MRTSEKLMPWSVGAIVVMLCWGMLAAQAAAPRLLPFQGRLTDAAGSPVSNGTQVIQFKLYEQPVGGTPVWPGEVHVTTVNGGLVNVQLGTKTVFADGFDFDRQLYLEITLDVDGDQTISPADPPMLPRQVVLPVIHAKEASNSRQLDGYDWANAPGVLIPVGGIIMWWGDKASIPLNFELCDGTSTTNTPTGAPFQKPNLMDKFIKGAATNDTLRSDLGAAGSHTNSSRTQNESLTKAQLPSGVTLSGTFTTTGGGEHSHDIALPYQAYVNGSSYAIRHDTTVQGNRTFTTDTEAAHTHNVDVSLSLGGSGTGHSHALVETDRRPAFQELFFIIRVK